MTHVHPKLWPTPPFFFYPVDVKPLPKTAVVWTGQLREPIQLGHSPAREIRKRLAAQGTLGRLLLAVLGEENGLLFWCARRITPNVHRPLAIAPPVAAPIQRIRSVRTWGTRPQWRSAIGLHWRLCLPNPGLVQSLLRSLCRQVGIIK